MASTYSPNLRLELIGTGEQQGTWGTTTNTNLGTLLEEAIGGYASVTVSDVGDTTLTTNNGSADESRNMVINLTGTITAARNVICPAIEKLYVVKNATTGGFDITFKVTGKTGVTIPNGQTYFLYVSGSAGDANKIVGNVASTNATNTFTENQIISVTDNTDAALRITQLGTGDALLVEDSSNPDSTPFVVKANGYVGIGLTDPSQALEINGNALLETSGSGGNSPFLTLTNTSGATPGSFGPGISFDNSVANTHGFVISQMQDSDSQLVISNSESPYTSFMSVNQEGYVNIGTSDDPASILQITGATTPTGVVVGSISGTTLTVTSISSPASPPAISVGDRLFISGSGLDYNTYVTSQTSGTTGGTGVYVINNSATVSSTTIYCYPSSYNTIGFVETDTTSTENQPLGGIEWYGSDATTAGAGVKAYVSAVSDDANGNVSLRFGAASNTASTQAVEAMRVYYNGNVGIGEKAPAAKLTVSASTSSDAVRITQTGSGNAIVVEDSSSPDSTPFIVKADGKVGINTTSPDALLSVNGVASFGDGAVGAPSIANFGDLNTGMWFPAADTIAFSTGGSEAARITSNNDLQVAATLIRGATTTPIDKFADGGVSPMLQQIGTTTNSSTVGIANFSSTVAPRIILARSLGTTIGTYTSAQDGDNLGVIAFQGSDSSDFGAAAQIVATAKGSYTSTNHPSELGFYTANTAEASPSERMLISKEGRVGIGTSTPASLLDVNGGITTSKTGLDAGSGNTSPSATDGNLYSGTYTPTLSGISNVAASTAYSTMFMRVGEMVTVAGRVDIQATATGATVLEMRVPYSTDFNSVGQCCGTFANGGSTGSYGAITSNTSSDRAVFTFVANTTASRTYNFSFTYLIR